MGHNGESAIARALHQMQNAPAEVVHVMVPAGPDGQHVQMPWQAALIWELDQLRVVGMALLQRGGTSDQTQS